MTVWKVSTDQGFRDGRPSEEVVTEHATEQEAVTYADLLAAASLLFGWKGHRNELADDPDPEVRESWVWDLWRDGTTTTWKPAASGGAIGVVHQDRIMIHVYGEER